MAQNCRIQRSLVKMIRGKSPSLAVGSRVICRFMQVVGHLNKSIAIWFRILWALADKIPVVSTAPEPDGAHDLLL